MVMAVVSIASAKGGCGKTTTSILIGAELALRHDLRVALLDSDVNQHASAFGKKASITGLMIIPAIDEQNVLPALREAEDKNDIVLIDLPGGSSTLALKAMQRSHFVLVPTQMSLLDARDAMKTVTQIDDAQELVRLPIARALLWTRVLSTFESRAARRVRTDLEQIGQNKGNLHIMKSALMERTAFREMLLTNRVPRQDGTGVATENVEAVTIEVLEQLKQLAESV
jgi:chromosome partitioning protein